jgi:outer membrane protein assembly factor BamB
MFKNIRTIKLIFGITIIAGLLSACTGGLAGSSWPGLSASEDTIFVSGGTGVFAVRTTDGAMLWRYPEKPENTRSFYAAPEVLDDQVIVGDYLGVIHSLDPKTAMQKWMYSDQKGKIIGKVHSTDDAFYVPSADHSLYALNTNGNFLWKFTTDHSLWASPISNGDKIYFSSMDHYLYAVKSSDGSEAWRADLGGAAVASPALDQDGTLYIGTLANEIIALDSESGTIQWRKPVTAALWSRVVAVDGALYFGDLEGNLYSLDANDGLPKWNLESVCGAVIGSPALTPEGLIYGCEDGQLVSVGFDGQRKWSLQFNGKLYTTPVVTSDRIIVAITQGDELLKAVDFQGKILWSFMPPK